MATIDEFALKNSGLWWRYGISRHCDEWKYIIIGRIFESEIILIPPSLKISESSSNGSYRNTDEVWWRYGISRSCDEWCTHSWSLHEHWLRKTWRISCSRNKCAWPKCYKVVPSIRSSRHCLNVMNGQWPFITCKYICQYILTAQIERLQYKS
jgi:hypothetical protein